METIFAAKSDKTHYTVYHAKVGELIPNFGGSRHPLLIQETPSWIVETIDLESDTIIHNEYHVDDIKVLAAVARIWTTMSFHITVNKVHGV